MSKSQNKMIIWLNKKGLKFEMLGRTFKVGSKRYLPKWVYGGKVCLYQSDRNYLKEYPNTIVVGFNDGDEYPIIEKTLEQLMIENIVEFIDRYRYKNIRIPFNQYLIIKAYCKKRGITIEALMTELVDDMRTDTDKLYH